jgi:hypothetical protein
MFANMPTETQGIVYLAKPQDAGGGIDLDSFKMNNVRRATILLLMEDITVGSPIVKLYSGATAGTKTTAETFRYRFSDAAIGTAGADTFGDWATSAALTVTHTTYDNFLLVMNIDADQLTDGQPWVTVEIGAEATEFTIAAVALLDGPRFAQNDMPTAIA